MESSFIGSSEPSSCHTDNDIAQKTRLKSEPHRHFSRISPGKFELPVSPVKMLARREANFSGRSRFSSADACHILSRYLPINGPKLIDKRESHGSTAQFSADGSLFVAGFHDGHIRIYNVDSGWKVQNNIQAKNLWGTIQDTSLSPDQRFLVYATASPIIRMVDIRSATKESVADNTEIHEPLDFSAGYCREFGYGSWTIFSVKFSSNGQELVTGSSDAFIRVYDLGANRLSYQVPAHMSHVNTACFADESGQVIYSGGNDGVCMVWDRRNKKGCGVLVGHQEGVTYIDSGGDGRSLISYGVYETIKLWDIRKMISSITHKPSIRNSNWYHIYPNHLRNSPLLDDTSVATYRGHSISALTSMRCYFSPAYSTGQKYIYTGSADGSVYIYDLLSTDRVAKLSYHDCAVRYCAWHPHYPTLVSSSWDGEIAKCEGVSSHS